MLFIISQQVQLSLGSGLFLPHPNKVDCVCGNYCFGLDWIFGGGKKTKQKQEVTFVSKMFQCLKVQLDSSHPFKMRTKGSLPSNSHDSGMRRGGKKTS